MGKIRRGGYVFEWWIGDHEPRHVHVSKIDGRILGRIVLATKLPMDAWNPPKKVLA
ncbi:MAG: hypothetical protein WC076_11390 [Terrimicrobiaceae bacterium]|jgi:hypothetical protein